MGYNLYSKNERPSCKSFKTHAAKLPGRDSHAGARLLSKRMRMVRCRLGMFYIVMSPWFSRGWTALELKMSQKVHVIFNSPNGPITKELDEDILYCKEKSNHCVSREHEVARGILKRLRGIEISRGLLVKPSVRRDETYLDCYCDYFGPVYFHPLVMGSEIESFDLTWSFKVHVGYDQTIHSDNYESTNKENTAQRIIEDMKNGSPNPQYRKREMGWEYMT
ncbi:hypothetical protein N7491_000028 [Penicillium cf. griseofulvum]|nr:hypothetical protein N7491_000028 [Penicillium cf. griseofulvum]